MAILRLAQSRSAFNVTPEGGCQGLTTAFLPFRRFTSDSQCLSIGFATEGAVMRGISGRARDPVALADSGLGNGLRA